MENRPQYSSPVPGGNDRPPRLHPMVVLQPGERVVCELKRHPFGILILYFAALLVVGGLGALVVSLLSSNPELSTEIYLGSALVLTMVLLVLGVATTIYWQNQWVVTTDSITQISQTGLFGRQVSQLSMDNLEDVTVDQHGILPHLFNFGTLKVESAGERSKFMFPYCPRPNVYARQILEIHEGFLEERRNIQRTPHAPTSTTTRPPLR